MRLIHELAHNAFNVPGWRTKRHLVVLESDDWGSIRTPSRVVYNKLIELGIPMEKDPYCRYDGLATKKDLSDLFEVLNSVHDSKGNPAILTANTVVANPMFELIRSSGFEEYHYEPFTESLSKSPDHVNSFELWKEGMLNKLFHPQLHGREHLNFKKWLNVLKEGPSNTRIAFDYGCFGLTSFVDPTIRRSYMGAFNSGLDEDIISYNTILSEASQLFERLFGYNSESFIATTYTWSPKIEPCLKGLGVKYLQGIITHKNPLDDDITIKYEKTGFQGTRSEFGLIRLMRNCFFEPSLEPNKDVLDDCLHRIRIAFRWGKAANICCHRVNFIGSIDSRNTDKNLPLFRSLLKSIVEQWPNVEFVTSDQLGHIIETEIRGANK